METVEDALNHCRQRNAQGISCTLHLLDEYIRDPHAARDLAQQYSTLIDSMEGGTVDGSISIKLTSLGALADTDLARQLALDLAVQAEQHRMGFEIDMEGRGLIDVTLDTALFIRRQGHAVVLALQAYLERSRNDTHLLLDAGVIPRLVKGAYAGDVSGFVPIEKQFQNLAADLLDSQTMFHVGTHDPLLLSWLKERLGDRKERVKFGFLLGLADHTKESMAQEGWDVSEYIPIGKEGVAYISRREQYLSELARRGRNPAP